MIARVQIQSIGAGGVGVARLDDGLTVFVPRTAPGDVVDIDVTDRKPNWGRGRLNTLVEAGPDRVDPPCHHYVADDCGGCQLQHLSAEAQREAKSAIIGNALRRIGGFDVSDPEVVPAPETWGYRQRVRFTARTGGVPGYRPYDDPDAGFVVEECPVADPGLMELWLAVREAVATQPSVREVSLRRDREGKRHILLEKSDVAVVEDVAAASGAGEDVHWWARNGPVGPVTGAPVRAFEQSNPTLAANIRNDAVEFLAADSLATVWDLYAGLGDTARLLGPRVGTVWAVDSDDDAMEWAADEPGDGDLRFVAGTVEEAAAKLPTPDAMVLNPPRSGLSKPARKILRGVFNECPSMKVAYISCDPATLGRDLRALDLEVEVVRGYDQFPQTSHVETLVGAVSR